MKAEKIRKAKQKESEETRKLNIKIKYAQKRQLNIVNDETKK